ncbi:transporter substrate-binding domain-containing protein (plasmid) [Rhizobium acidisoli]|uniref:Transporter substrate-binding domain-containing protein n=1 Tax=Rhizobium acidisoli TaxID=1538158 RepID=A0AAE6C507_9HYPH|nr:transporter substrate-binding domain-containing protein [Rhizobium acidisoli]KPH07560.1 hypothetical protein AOG23_17090 [Rhizobium acidisoli]QAS82887.1 transporter substrate-binding domain-containing protein [Rhizobium acidisoli]
MKLLPMLFAGAALALSAVTAQAEVRFGVMNESYPPFFAKDASGEWHGWEIDLMNAVCTEMKEKCSIVDISWDGLIPALQSKKFDVIWSSGGLRKEDTELKAKLNAAIAAVRANGQYDAITKKYFDFDIYGAK